MFPRQLYRLLFTFVAVAALQSSKDAIGQDQAAPVSKTDLRGRWIVTVDTEADTRTLIITEVANTSEGALLAARYGLTKTGQGPVEAKILLSGETRQLRFVTQASTVVTATEQADGSFSGTFARKNGVVDKVVISRAPAGMAPVALPQKDFTAMIPPAAEVPPSCSAFHGTWSGTWSQGGFAEQFLRVHEVALKDGKCSLRLSYSSSRTPVPARVEAELDGQTLSFLCNRSTGGTCIFRRSGEDLWANYTNPGGGNNSAVFRRATQ